jgi:hypothetical protein
MDFITIPVVVGIITLGIYSLFELIIRKKERLSIIEKIGNKLEPSSIDSKFPIKLHLEGRSSFNTLKIACLLLGVGLGLLVGYFICLNSLPGYNPGNGDYNMSQTTGVIFGASVLLFGGLGLLIAFIVELNYTKKKN